MSDCHFATKSPCPQPTTEKNKTTYFGGLKSFKVIYADIIKSLVIRACYDSSMYVGLPICNRFHATRVISSKITTI